MASVTTSIVDGASSITVAVRVRPFTIREAAQLRPDDEGKLFLGDGSLAAAPAPKLNQRGLRSVIKVVDDRCLVFDPPEDSPVQKFSRSVVPTSGKKVKDQVFAFDRVFDNNTSQTEVYEGTTKDLLDSVLDGYNATVFAYGATGCGKTHTITGTAQHPGIIFMTMQELFEKIQDRSQEKTTEVSLSYLEIYNETIRDLLVPGGSKQGLMLREDSAHSVTVAGLTSHHPKDVQEVMDMIVQGNEYRTVSPTEANATSSRSHAVLQINVAQKDRNADINEPHTMATLSIIDLAGSERASATKNRGERLLEGANINKSLLALGGCINALCDPRKRNHVPYRNSKLTRLLKFSLGGNCKTVMIVCVSPSSAHFDETQNTLRYANRAKNIQTKVTRNVFNVNRHVKDFLVKIDEQMALINELKAQQRDAETIFYAKFRKQLERRDVAAQEGTHRLRAAYENAAAERQEKVANMKRLRAFERRIRLLGAWGAAFDAVCDARGDEQSMPPSLVAIRKTAQGILVELENSRYHVHQKLKRCNWERSLDSALQHSLRQLADAPGAEGAEAAAGSLTREAEALKTSFMRDAYWEVLEHEKGADAAAMQALLTAQFEILASLSDTLEMSEEEAVSRAKQIIGKLLETGFAASSHVVRADGGSLPKSVAHMQPPPRKGTPRKRPPLAAAASRRESTKPIVQPSFAPATLIPSPSARSAANTSTANADDSQVLAGCSPIKMSPRRRKVHPARKGVSLTPQKRKSISKRAVRWRDDDGEDGTLADFEKTPQKFAPNLEPVSPSPSKATPLPPPPAMPAYLETGNDSAMSLSDGGGSGGSPSLRQLPEKLPETTTSIPAAKPNRFQAGFLSKSRLSSAPKEGSPQPRIPGLSLNLASSDTDDKPSPGKDANLTPPSMTGLKRTTIPRRSLSATLDENTPSGLVPPRNWSSNMSSGMSSDSDSPGIDPLKVRSALQAKKQRERRISSISTAAVSSSSAKRLSSISSIPERVSIGPGGLSSLGMTSLPTRQSLGAGGGYHNSNGISRRRESLGRRKLPPVPCSPPGWNDMPHSLTLGQARRMNLGNHSFAGSHNHSIAGNMSTAGPSSSSPREPPSSFMNSHARAGVRSRRTTIGASGSSLRAKPQGFEAWR